MEKKSSYFFEIKSSKYFLDTLAHPTLLGDQFSKNLDVIGNATQFACLDCLTQLHLSH